MNPIIKKLGKVAITIEKDYWSDEKEYDKLTVVEQEHFATFISRKKVPIGTPLTDRDYWIPFSSLKEEIVLQFDDIVNQLRNLEDTVDIKESEIYKAIASIVAGGVALKQSFGDSEEFGISQKILTESRNHLQSEIDSLGTVLEQAQEQINENTYRKDETYSKEELDNLITTPDVNYVNVSSYTELPETGAADTIYRVANYDGTSVVSNTYCEYAWDGSVYKLLAVKQYGIDDAPTLGSDNLVKSGGVKSELNKIEAILYGEGQEYDSEKAYFTIQLNNTGSLNFQSVWDSTNIKNEAAESCTIDFGDGSGSVSIVDRDSMKKDNVPAGTYIVSITGITSVLNNNMFRESTLLIDAKLPSTLISVVGWLFNGVPNMSEVAFMGTTPPTFSGNGAAANSLNLVSVIKVPQLALSAYQSSTMSDVMKTKLEALPAGIVEDIADMKAAVTNLQDEVDETNESVQELTDYVDSRLPAPLDKTKTYFTIEVPAGNRDLRTIYNATNIKNELAGTCTIDYGDGTPVVAINSADDLFHNYAQAGTYTLIVTGLTGLTSNLLFREMPILKDAKFGNTFVNPSTYYMLNGVTMESVTFFAETPLTWNFGTTYGGANMNLVSKIIVPSDSLLSYLKAWYFNTSSSNKDYLTKRIVPDEPVDYYYKPITVTVGQSGDFTSLNDAIQSLSTSYSVYQAGGLKAVIKILSGMTITEQVYVDGLDLSWITIEYEDYNPDSLIYDNVAESIADGTIVFDATEGYNSVSVDATNFKNTSHDQRGDFTLFRAENGARLPIIGCVFKLTTPHASTGIAGVVCNRGSEAVVKTLCGFIGFQDGVISNNESSITIREGITMNCSRWGCHARHNGEVSARSVIATGCATNTSYSSEYGAAVADRVADMDVREAYLSGNYAIRCHNASSICARAAHVIGGGVENAYLVQATYSGKINASQMTFTNIVEGSKMFEVTYAGWIDAFSVTNKTYNVDLLNAINGTKGIIWG